jgi:hypothetical protein
MSTRPDTPFEHDAIDPYAPRWVRDPSYQVLRRAETLKRSALNPEQTEPVPSVPCKEPDLPHDFPPFLMKNQQLGHDDHYIGNIRVPPSLLPRHSLAPKHEWEPWPHRWAKKRRNRRKAVYLALVILAAVSAPYFLLWRPSADQAAGTIAPTARASLVPVAAKSPERRPEPTRVKTVRITPKLQERSPGASAETATVAARPKPSPSAQPTPAPQYKLASAAWQPLPASAAATPAAASPWQAKTSEPPAAAKAAPAIAEKPPATELDEETVALLVKRGQRFIDAGDLASARVVLRRAAEAGNREAALAMAGTYDPAALKRLGVKGLAPDPEKARFWYQKAQQLGSKEAPQLLKQLANRTN